MIYNRRKVRVFYRKHLEEPVTVLLMAALFMLFVYILFLGAFFPGA